MSLIIILKFFTNDNMSCVSLIRISDFLTRV